MPSKWIEWRQIESIYWTTLINSSSLVNTWNDLASGSLSELTRSENLANKIGHTAFSGDIKLKPVLNFLSRNSVSQFRSVSAGFSSIPLDSDGFSWTESAEFIWIQLVSTHFNYLKFRWFRPVSDGLAKLCLVHLELPTVTAEKVLKRWFSLKFSSRLLSSRVSTSGHLGLKEHWD